MSELEPVDLTKRPPIDLGKHRSAPSHVSKKQESTPIPQVTPRHGERDSHNNDQRPRLVRQIGQRAMNWWHDEDRPGLFELHWYYLPMAVVVAASAVEVADDVLGTHIKDTMAGVCVEQHSNGVYKFLEGTIQEVGREAGGDVCKPTPTDIPNTHGPY